LEAGGPFEDLKPVYQTTQRYTPQGSRTELGVGVTPMHFVLYPLWPYAIQCQANSACVW
jgi:hypothetical protein